ncbi:MAG: IclR family transcriptional regulator [Thermodesulfobacteriota bacterium]
MPEMDIHRPIGAQSIKRAISLLRAVANHNHKGVRLSRVAREVNLHVATTHRMLGVLTSEGLVSYDNASKRYHLGVELYSLGVLARQFNLRNHYRSALERIAAQTGDSVYLVTRSGYDSVCVDLIDGTSPIRIMSYHVGKRVPLGMGAGSLALIAYLPDDRLETILTVNEPRYRQHHDRTLEDIRAAVRQARELGYTVTTDLYTKGVTGVGLPILDRRREVKAAVSVCAISERMEARRQAEIADLLKSEIDCLGSPEEEDEKADRLKIEGTDS